MTKKKEETRLVWKLKERPSAEGVAMLVEQGVLDKSEARDIVLKETKEDTDEVKALKEMVKTLQDLVQDMLSKPNIQYVPYVREIEVPRRQTPYWEKYWITTTGTSPITFEANSASNGTINYTMSLNQ